MFQRNQGGLYPRYNQPAGTQRDRWMVSYLDVVTIALMLFVGIAAQSLSAARASLPQAADSQPPPSAATETSVSDPPPEPPDPTATAAKRESSLTLVRAKDSLESRGVEVRMDAEGLVISLPQAVLFASGKDRVDPKALPIVSQIADVLREIPNQVRIVGHADSVPIHTPRFKNNWDLATARSLNIQALLTNRYRIPESRLSIASYGPNRPSSSNETPAGRAQNRRVEILILDEPKDP